MSNIKQCFEDLKEFFDKNEYEDAEHLIKILNIMIYELPEKERISYKKLLDKYKIEIDKKNLFEYKNVNNIQHKNNSLEILQNSHKILLETEEVANNTANNLKQQSEKIKNIDNKLNNINEDLAKSNNILRKMLTWWRG